jgi:hypothetical protein
MKLLSLALALLVAGPGAAEAQDDTTAYRVLATNKTSTMQKEMQETAAAGFRFVAVMGGETSFGGNEVVVVMQKVPTGRRFEYRLLAANRTSTLQKELQDAGDAGFSFVGQTVFESLFGGKEVAAILERDPDGLTDRWEYKLVATSRTSTLQKELQALGNQGFQALGMTVGQTAVGGAELVVITRRKVR